MTKDGPSFRGGEASKPESSPTSSTRRAGGGNGGAGGGPPPPPPPRPSSSALVHEDHRRELEALRAELEAERLRSQEARRHFALEARELREAAEKERQLLADQLRSKWEQQRARELHQLKEAGLREREAEIRQLLRWKEAELRQAQELLQRERDAAMRQARDLQRQLAEELVGRCKGQNQGLTGESRAKLQEVLGKLRWEVDGEQAARIRHLKAELELERSLFLKYILQRFEGEQPTLGFPQRGPSDPPKVTKSGPHSLSSLLAACQASKPCVLESDCESPQRQGQSSRTCSKSRCSQEQQQQTPEKASRKQKDMEDKSHFPQEQQTFKNILGKEVPMEEKFHSFVEQEVPKQTLGKEAPMENNSHFSQEQHKAPCITFEEEMSMENGAQQEDNEEAPPEENKSSAVLSVATRGQEEPQEPKVLNWLSGNNYDELVKQNSEFLKALVDLEQRCTNLKNENALLRENRFPEMQEKVKRLKKKNADLIGIAKRLEERAKRLQESSLKVSSSHIPVALGHSDMEVYKTSFARQRAKDRSEQACVLLAKDQELEALQRECWEHHSRLSAGKESQYMLNSCDFERLLRESQKEVLRLQRQIMLKNLRESLARSKMNSDSVSSPVSSQETSLDISLENTSLPKEKLNILVKNVESESLLAGNGIKNQGKSLLEIDSDTEHRMQTLKEKLSEKSKQCDTLENEIEEKRERCEKLERQLEEVLKENIRISEENSHLHQKNELTEKRENENTELNRKLVEARDARNSAVQLTKGLESKVENLEQIISNLKEIVERRQKLVSEHEQTLLVLQTKEEEIRQLQQTQEKTKRENDKTVEELEARVKELECFNLQAQGLGQRQEKMPGIVDVESSHATYIPASVVNPSKGNEVTHHSFHSGGNRKNCDKNRAPRECSALLQQAKGLETHSSASESDSIHNRSQSCPNPKEDTTEETQELESDQISINLDLENPGPPKLRVFLARYSYNPFDGPNKNPETELPLTAGEYVYICGDMDEDGFYEGELMDGRRGMIPSNLVEEVSSNELISFLPLEEAGDISFHYCHEVGCPYQNVNSEEGNNNTNDMCIDLLSNDFGGEMCDDQAAVPYPRNLTLIRQLNKSIIIGWDPPKVTDNWKGVHSYNIYVNEDLCCNVKHTSQMKAMIENLDLKSRSYRISVQSVTDKGRSEKLQCTFLVGHGFHVAPTLLEIRSITATSAEITWLPSNSNYTHTVYLNEKEYDVTEAGVYWYTFRNLKPNTQYKIKVETRAPFEAFPQGHLERKSRAITFTTLLVGLPNPPLDVQVHPNSTAEFLIISWLPVTIDTAGSSNGVKVTGYAIYLNGWKVTEVMSPTAGSVSLEASQLCMFHRPCKVFVKTLSPYGESVGSVPALIPDTLLSTLRPSLPTPVVCNQAAESDDGSIATAHKASLSLHSQPSMSNAENNFTIHFTSNCKELDTSTPGDIPQNQESSPTWATLQKARNDDDVFSNLSPSFWERSSECVFPASRRVESVSYTQAEAQAFPKESQKKRSKKHLPIQKTPTFKSKSDSKTVSVQAVTQPVNISKDSLSQHYVKNYGTCFWSPSMEVTHPKSSGSRRTGPNDICLEEEPDGFLEKTHSQQMTQLCKAFSNIKGAQEGTEQISRPGSWRSPLGHHSSNSDSSDFEEEEEYRIHFACPKSAGVQVRPMSPPELAEKEMLIRQTVPSLPNPNPQENLIRGSTLNEDSERLFVALFDYDPLTMSPNSEAAGEELSFKEGQILKVIGDKDVKGYYRGECVEKQGYIPCHMVSEIYIESKEVKEHLLKKSYTTEENL